MPSAAGEAPLTVHVTIPSSIPINDEDEQPVLCFEDVYNARVKVLERMSVVIRKVQSLINSKDITPSMRKLHTTRYDNICASYVIHINALAMYCLSHQHAEECEILLVEARRLSDPKWSKRCADLRVLTLNNFACLCRFNNDCNLSIQILKEALKLSRMVSDDCEHLAVTHLLLCAAYSVLGRHEPAYKHTSFAINIAQHTIRELGVSAATQRGKTKRASRMKKRNLSTVLNLAYYDAAIEANYLGMLSTSQEFLNKSDNVLERNIRWHLEYAVCPTEQERFSIANTSSHGQDDNLTIEPYYWHLEEDKNLWGDKLFQAWNTIKVHSSPQRKVSTTQNNSSKSHGTADVPSSSPTANIKQVLRRRTPLNSPQNRCPSTNDELKEFVHEQNVQMCSSAVRQVRALREQQFQHNGRAQNYDSEEGNQTHTENLVPHKTTTSSSGRRPISREPRDQLVEEPLMASLCSTPSCQDKPYTTGRTKHSSLMQRRTQSPVSKTVQRLYETKKSSRENNEAKDAPPVDYTIKAPQRAQQRKAMDRLSAPRSELQAIISSANFGTDATPMNQLKRFMANFSVKRSIRPKSAEATRTKEELKRTDDTDGTSSTSVEEKSYTARPQSATKAPTGGRRSKSPRRRRPNRAERAAKAKISYLHELYEAPESQAALRSKHLESPANKTQKRRKQKKKNSEQSYSPVGETRLTEDVETQIGSSILSSPNHNSKDKSNTEVIDFEYINEEYICSDTTKVEQSSNCSLLEGKEDAHVQYVDRRSLFIDESNSSQLCEKSSGVNLSDKNIKNTITSRKEFESPQLPVENIVDNKSSSHCNKDHILDIKTKRSPDISDYDAATLLLSSIDHTNDRDVLDHPHEVSQQNKSFEPQQINPPDFEDKKEIGDHRQGCILITEEEDAPTSERSSASRVQSPASPDVTSMDESRNFASTSITSYHVQDASQSQDDVSARSLDAAGSFIENSGSIYTQESEESLLESNRKHSPRSSHIMDSSVMRSQDDVTESDNLSYTHMVSVTSPPPSSLVPASNEARSFHQEPFVDSSNAADVVEEHNIHKEHNVAKNSHKHLWQVDSQTSGTHTSMSKKHSDSASATSPNGLTHFQPSGMSHCMTSRSGHEDKAHDIGTASFVKLHDKYENPSIRGSAGPGDVTEPSIETEEACISDTGSGNTKSYSESTRESDGTTQLPTENTVVKALAPTRTAPTRKINNKSLGNATDINSTTVSHQGTNEGFLEQVHVENLRIDKEEKEEGDRKNLHGFNNRSVDDNKDNTDSSFENKVNDKNDKHNHLENHARHNKHSQEHQKEDNKVIYTGTRSDRHSEVDLAWSSSTSSLLSNWSTAQDNIVSFESEINESTNSLSCSTFSSAPSCSNTYQVNGNIHGELLFEGNGDDDDGDRNNDFFARLRRPQDNLEDSLEVDEHESSCSSFSSAPLGSVIFGDEELDGLNDPSVSTFSSGGASILSPDSAFH